jgi:hypothetical protein
MHKSPQIAAHSLNLAPRFSVGGGNSKDVGGWRGPRSRANSSELTGCSSAFARKKNWHATTGSLSISLRLKGSAWTWSSLQELPRGYVSGCVPSTNCYGREPSGFRRNPCTKYWASSALPRARAISRGRHRDTFSERRMTEIGLSGSMSRVCKRKHGGASRHRLTKGPATDTLHLNHRATPRLHTNEIGQKPDVP